MDKDRKIQDAFELINDQNEHPFYVDGGESLIENLPYMEVRADLPDVQRERIPEYNMNTKKWEHSHTR